MKEEAPSCGHGDGIPGIRDLGNGLLEKIPELKTFTEGEEIHGEISAMSC